ncbi:response regulator transcription factor [Enterococcus pallens]|uniref:AraC family transcriptional regulator n=1 Tax=Enterococcus pallens ATCC BAA-351 TaxID=1158607 RepID=R2SQY3_9ENTE|nr:response regulator [Enterococcus pallens]EOH97675.1 hypothetical protein UAU_00343 [Enterococcus pallens ATCC BAA-351]EOU20906.1 hypothetical protein I588_01753 [Enterococcus pallens ATCC BAA-351]OJG80215.1 hypothetical protein RV10_GL004866 [Enterococcus pallens]
MNTLIVDDDRYIIQALQEKIDWEDLGIETVFSAYNMRQAQGIIKEHHIDLLISDIEMPQGSGLQLLAWIRQENYHLQAIFLTNYADFNYAQKAIELQSFEYFLKPIEFDKLELIIRKVLKRIKQEAFQQKSHSLIEDSFWFDYLRKSTLQREAEFLFEAASKKVSVSKDEKLLPAVITLDLLEQDTAIENHSWSKLLRETLVTATAELTSLSLVTSFKIDNYSDKYFCLLKTSPAEFSKLQVSVLHDLVTDKLNKTNQFVVGELSSMENILVNTHQIYHFIQDFCGHNDQLYFISKNSYPLPDHEVLKLNFSNFLTSSSESLEELIQKEIGRYEKKDVIAMTILKSLRPDLIQKIGIYLDQKEILAHKLFQNPKHDFLIQRSYNSIEAFVRYVSYYIQTAKDQVDFLESKQSIAQLLLDYIDRHYTEEINRKTLAEHFFLSPDYLARLFKKETGDTLINYLTEKRVARGKELLLETETPVYLIASQIGYDNYSYFSKVFKKTTGMSPIDFRNEGKPS